MVGGNGVSSSVIVKFPSVGVVFPSSSPLSFPKLFTRKQVISTEPTGRVRKAVEIFQFLECFQHMRLLAGLQSVFVLFSLLLFHKPYQVLEIPIKSGNSHLDVEFCDSCDEEDTASVLAWMNNANVKGAYRVNFC